MVINVAPCKVGGVLGVWLLQLRLTYAPLLILSLTVVEMSLTSSALVSFHFL